LQRRHAQKAEVYSVSLTAWEAPPQGRRGRSRSLHTGFVARWVSACCGLPTLTVGRDSLCRRRHLGRPRATADHLFGPRL